MDWLDSEENIEYEIREYEFPGNASQEENYKDLELAIFVAEKLYRYQIELLDKGYSEIPFKGDKEKFINDYIVTVTQEGDFECSYKN